MIPDLLSSLPTWRSADCPEGSRESGLLGSRIEDDADFSCIVPPNWLERFLLFVPTIIAIIAIAIAFIKS